MCYYRIFFLQNLLTCKEVYLHISAKFYLKYSAETKLLRFLKGIVFCSALYVRVRLFLAGRTAVVQRSTYSAFCLKGRSTLSASGQSLNPSCYRHPSITSRRIAFLKIIISISARSLVPHLCLSPLALWMLVYLLNDCV